MSTPYRDSQARFIQIAVGKTCLYALDEQGQVWWLDDVSDEAWSPLTSARDERHPLPRVDEVEDIEEYDEDDDD